MQPDDKIREPKAHTFLYSIIPFFYAVFNFYAMLRGAFCVENIWPESSINKLWCAIIGDDFRPDFLLPFLIAPVLTWIIIAKPKWRAEQYGYIIWGAWLLCVLSFVLRYFFYNSVPSAVNF